MSAFRRSFAVFAESVLAGFAFAIGWVMAMVMLTAVVV
jgi:Na+-translocating ferredoxin:NAD+ oxidoreductase RnfA subunit